MKPRQVSVSVVSHRQRALLATLLSDLNAHCRETVTEILITENVKEGLDALIDGSSIPVRILENAAPKGFGANHNHAFRLARGEYFCVANPDVRFQQDPFERLVDCVESRQAALAAPRVVDQGGMTEDSARLLPTPFGILRKALGLASKLDYPDSNAPFFPDWVAGMFMLFRREAFTEVDGFDEGYHLYYEDVDICARLRLSGHKVVLCPGAVVIHSARRESHRDPHYFKWHLKSMLRFFTSPTYFKCRRSRRKRREDGPSG